MHRLFWLLMGMFLLNQSYAFKCFMTIIKDSCWTDYTVTVDVTDGSTGKHSATATIPAGTSWARQQFDCEAGETLALAAKFTPVIWKGQEDKIYPAQRYWQLPKEVLAGVTGWNVTVCFPKWFEDVPMPPKATANCVCETDNIPQISPEYLGVKSVP